MYPHDLCLIELTLILRIKSCIIHRSEGVTRWYFTLDNRVLCAIVSGILWIKEADNETPYAMK